jgi:hypothetical protein
MLAIATLRLCWRPSFISIQTRSAVEWVLCISVMYERMSNAHVRLNLFMKSFGENDILREH